MQFGLGLLLAGSLLSKPSYRPANSNQTAQPSQNSRLVAEYWSIELPRCWRCVCSPVVRLALMLQAAGIEQTRRQHHGTCTPILNHQNHSTILFLWIIDQWWRNCAQQLYTIPSPPIDILAQLKPAQHLTATKPYTEQTPNMKIQTQNHTIDLLHGQTQT